MDLGFETIGNATVICYDQGPVLVTDPWITSQAYFGSWTHTHEIPEEQRDAILRCPFVWFSHGHPDHLNPLSLPQFHGRHVLIPDHYGSRIHHDLLAQNFDVTVLKDRVWTSLSDRIKVFCIADYNQDAILLIDIGGTLIVNSNDAALTGWQRYVRKLAGGYKRTVRLAIAGVGDADMCNFFDESGQRLEFLANPADAQIGKDIARHTDRLGLRYFVPFSSMHKYQREDSAWANRHVTSLADYRRGYDSKFSEILPAYIRYDLIKETIDEIDPSETASIVYPPESFGDNWAEPLSKANLDHCKAYFSSIEHLPKFLDFVNLRVGGSDNFIELRRRQFDRGITFEVPRKSLMQAISGEIFDDLLIGNFMRTTLQGKWGAQRLYPDFTPFVAKFGDNGQAKTESEVRAYFESYRRRAPLDHLVHRVEQGGISKVMSTFSSDSAALRAAKGLYNLIKKKNNRKLTSS